MVDRTKLTAFYVAQYQADVQMRRNKNLKISDLPERVSHLRRQLRSANPRRLGMTALEEFHRQIRSLYEAGHYKHYPKVVEAVREELIPLLVRLDIQTLPEQQQEGVDGNFVSWLKEERPGEICYRPLFLLYPGYKEEIIREQMTGMVPTRPEMEFPDALEMNRRFILHIGPTNSGKTFQALERLKEAKNGIYLGPLRLLALEVYEKMREMGVPATMLTGQEYIEDAGSRVTCATVEMADLDSYYDVAVIDEAQMMADRDRGHSWTRALMGLKCAQIHICASPAAEQVLVHLIELCHDTCEIRRYERKTGLLFEEEPFSFPEDVQQGDALIVFSKKSVLDVAGRLEEQGVNASVIYGSLPPEIRRRQMHLFTQGQTKVVVSTDAIGMGLNLPVRRIIFLQVSKYDGTQQRLLTTPEIRQIAGRAGRFGIYETGYINGSDQESLDYLRETCSKAEEPVRRVSIGFPQVLLTIDEPLDEILKVWHDEKPIAPFEKENVDEMLFLYERALSMKEYIPEFEDKKVLYRMISCPIDIKDRKVVALWLEYCTSYAADVSLRKPVLSAGEKNGLAKYETYYKQLDTYYQMSYRLGKELDERWVARERLQTEDKIMRYLVRDRSRYIKRCRYCGRTLAIDSPFGYCDRCWKLSLGRGGGSAGSRKAGPRRERG